MFLTLTTTAEPATDLGFLLHYLPPTMSPVATSTRLALLEHPDQAFDVFRSKGIDAAVWDGRISSSRFSTTPTV